MKRFLEFPPETIQDALASWQWLPLAGKHPFLVTVFGDIFLRDAGGIHFLDTIEGRLELVCQTDAELESILASDSGAEKFLLLSLLTEAEARGFTLAPNECLNFEVDPVIGGALELSNVAARDFVVALDILGQIHPQLQNRKPGTPLTFEVVE